MTGGHRVLGFATKGSGTNEEHRLRELLQNVDSTFLSYDKSKKIKSFFGLLNVMRRAPSSTFVMEGTGIAGGFACMLGRVFFGHRYVVSSGDAVGPFIGSHYRILAIPFGIYERLLCRLCAGFIGWTPYLVGRAMTFGAPRGVTAPGWVIGRDTADRNHARSAARQRWGIQGDPIVFGIAGALVWSRGRQYCYGLELVRAIRRTDRDDVAVVVIGDGSGLERLQQEAGDDLGKRIFFPGRVPLDEVMDNLCGLDIASLPQSTDAVGAFRYTTKISEYRRLNLPVVTLRIPAAYDLDLGHCWRLPGDAPWDPRFLDALVDLMNSLSHSDVDRLRTDTSPDHVNPTARDTTFCRIEQVRRVTAFLNEIAD